MHDYMPIKDEELIASNRAIYQRGYLAGLEAARACVPDMRFHDHYESDEDYVAVTAHNACRDTTLANLTALEQEAKK